MKFIQKMIVLSLVFFNFCYIKAQNNCGSGSPGSKWEMEFQKLVNEYVTNQIPNRPQQTYVIPVIIHVIHGGEAIGFYPNIDPILATGQIATLNSDFAGTNMNTSNYPPTAFAAWAATANVSPASLNPNGRIAIANCNIQFCLATKDTNGNVLAEPGIKRYNYNTMGWPNPAAPAFNSLNAFTNLYENIIKPQTIWNVTKYLNIWVSANNTSLNSGFLGGYATYPNLSTLNDLPANSIGSATTDGVYCQDLSFGGYSHVASHEVGHWLGLWHTWGDTLCGNDYCNDTPPAKAATVGSPIYPYTALACPGSGNGVMFMNFMDYSSSTSMYMFTTDQANRMQTAMANSPHRKFLGTHNLCTVENFIYPAFGSANSVCAGKSFTLTNYSYGWPAPSSYTWSASGGTLTPGPQAISPGLKFSSPGIYTITLAASNGTAGVFTKTINVTNAPVNLSSTSQTVCPGAAANFTVIGTGSYTWQPGSIVNTQVNFTPLASQTYTCSGSEIPGCITKVLVDVVVSACVGIDNYRDNDLSVTIYPNPVENFINLNIKTNTRSELDLQITDAVGKIIHQDKTSLHANTQLLAIDISTWVAGIYFIKLQTSHGYIHNQKVIKKE